MLAGDTESYQSQRTLLLTHSIAPISSGHFGVLFPCAPRPPGWMWGMRMDACTCSGLHSRRGALSLVDSPFYSKQWASLIFVLEGDITSNLKAAHCSNILGNGPGKELSGPGISVSSTYRSSIHGRRSPNNIQPFFLHSNTVLASDYSQGYATPLATLINLTSRGWDHLCSVSLIQYLIKAPINKTPSTGRGQICSTDLNYAPRVLDSANWVTTGGTIVLVFHYNSLKGSLEGPAAPGVTGSKLRRQKMGQKQPLPH